jgi:signal transduction histidine kinase
MTGSSPLSHPALLAALSHELGSPLAAIKGATHARARHVAIFRGPNVIGAPTRDNLIVLQNSREAAHMALDQFHQALEIQRQEAR